jgi:hypothetical protein
MAGICVIYTGSEIFTRHFVCKSRNVRDHLLGVSVDWKMIVL